MKPIKEGDKKSDESTSGTVGDSVIEKPKPKPRPEKEQKKEKEKKDDDKEKARQEKDKMSTQSYPVSFFTLEIS